MLIGGLQKFSLLDYPGKISAIVFTQGCNFRCRFCYNPMLVWPVRDGKLKYTRGASGETQKVHPMIINQDDLFVFLKARAGKLDAVVITGGEPCLHQDLPKFIKEIKALGFLVKLDSNGSQPEVLAKLVKEKLVDYLAMDLKAPENKYGEVTGVETDFNNIYPVKPAELFNRVKKSVKIILLSGLPYEFRTTVVPELIDKDDIAEMGKIIKGADLWYLQNFKSQSELVDKEFMGKVPYNSRQMNEMVEIGRKYVKKCEVR